jgi:hypothetical protein
LVAIKDFGFVEVQFFWSSDWLSHSDSVDWKGSVEVSDIGKKIFDRRIWLVGSGFSEITRFD